MSINNNNNSWSLWLIMEVAALVCFLVVMLLFVVVLYCFICRFFYRLLSFRFLIVLLVCLCSVFSLFRFWLSLVFPVNVFSLLLHHSHVHFFSLYSCLTVLLVLLFPLLLISCLTVLLVYLLSLLLSILPPPVHSLTHSLALSFSSFLPLSLLVCFCLFCSFISTLNFKSRRIIAIRMRLNWKDLVTSHSYFLSLKFYCHVLR